MEKFGALDVIREESLDDDDDIDRIEMCVRFTSENANASAKTQERSSFVADVNSSYHGNMNHNVLIDKNMNTGEFKLPDSERKRMSSPNAMKKIKTIMEPTYRMEPKPDQYFIWYKVRNSLNKMISPIFESFKYQSPAAGNFCKMVCNKALTMIKKKYDWPRYRYICHVTLFQLNNQGVIVADRNLMYPGTDNCAVSLFKNKEIVLVVTLHGIFYE